MNKYSHDGGEDAGDVSQLNRFDQLDLAPGFEDIEFLSNAEVTYLLHENKKENEKNNIKVSEFYNDELHHVTHFSFPKDPVNNKVRVDELRNSLKSIQYERVDNEGNSSYDALFSYEIAALCNLKPDTVDEARIIIPSLRLRFNEEQIEEVLHCLKQFDGYA